MTKWRITVNGKQIATRGSKRKAKRRAERYMKKHVPQGENWKNHWVPKLEKDKKIVYHTRKPPANYLTIKKQNGGV